MSLNKSKLRILAIESSCDETAASVVQTDGADVKILSNVIASQIDIHKQFGGVFPEKASRAHAEKIIPVVEEALKEAEEISFCEVPVGAKRNRTVREAESKMIFRSRLDNIDLVAVTVGPGLIGSLLIGVNFAKTYAYVKNKPIIGINHWLGHIYSNFISHPAVIPSTPIVIPANAGIQSNLDSKFLNQVMSPRTPIRGQDRLCSQPVWNDIPEFPSLILIVSGGHTGLVLMKSHTDIQPLGETLDDAAGEAFDKVAKMLGLGYPGGPAISKIAQKGDPSAFDFPRSMLDRNDYNFSFSGLKTAVLYESKKHQEVSIQKKADFASSFQQAVIDILIGKTIKAAYEFKPKSICLCGGVSANKELRVQMQKAVTMLPWKATYHVPPIILSTDNAAMIGIAAAYQNKSKWTTFDKINADSNLKL